MYHISPVENRDSIHEHGFDNERMGTVRGIAGGSIPDGDGIYLCANLWEVDFFTGFPGGPVDVWEVDVSGLDLAESFEGFICYRDAIPPERLTLIERDRRRPPEDE